MTEYKYNVGDLVHVNETAYESLSPEMRKRLPSTFKTTLFTIANREHAGDTNNYFMPGYDWQCGHGWITEAWITKWIGDGPLSLSITIDPEGDTEEEVEVFTEAVLQQLRKVCEQFGVDFDGLSDVQIKQFEYVVNHLPEVDKLI